MPLTNMRTRWSATAATLIVLSLAGSGCENVPETGAAADASASSPTQGVTEQSLTSDVELLATASVRPDGVTEDAIIVNADQGLAEEWQRHGFTNEIPPVDFTAKAVLILAFPESSSCPVEFLGLQFEGQLVRFTVPADLDDAPSEELLECTDDDRPRSMAVAIPIVEAPTGAARIRLPGSSRELPISFDRP
jgi:hypothetical protein